jgi:hypothetical protein
MNNLNYRPQLRLTAVHNGPLRGDQLNQYGFYDAGIMRQMLNLTGTGEARIWALPIPKNNQDFTFVQNLIYDPKTQYALVDKNKIVICVISDSPGWMSAMNKLGYEVNSGPKTNKRLKSAHRPTLLNYTFDNLNVKIVEPYEYSRYDFFQENLDFDNAVVSKYRDPAVVERLLDGGFVISSRLIQAAVQNMPNFDPITSEDTRDYYYDPIIRKSMVKELLSARVFNARIICPLGFIKGNAIVADLPEGIDVITSSTNIKKEIRLTTGYQFQAEPQGSKKKVLTDDQTIINFPKLFPLQDMELWLSNEYEMMFNRAINNDLLTNWRQIYQRQWRDDQDLEENEARARSMYSAYRWTAGDMKLTESPWLFESVSISHAAPLKSRVPIPCALYEQIIPESLARMAGYDVTVEEYQIIRLNDVEVHVVNDLDWLEMYESHGGHDQDDFFKIFYREFEGGVYDGEKSVIAVRSPNGYGEYTVFNYVEGNYAPSWEMADGTIVQFPKIDGQDWPKRLSEIIDYGAVSYTGLPSESLPKQIRSGPYTQEDVLRDIRIAMSGGNVGGFVNASMCHSMVVSSHRPIQLCSLEDAIDKCINPDSAEDVAAIDQESFLMMREVIQSGKPIDQSFWTTRGCYRFANETELENINLQPGHLTLMFRMCSKYYAAYITKVRSWSQSNCKHRDIIHQLGSRLYGIAQPVLNDFRMKIHNVNSLDASASTGHIERNNWETMYLTIAQKIQSFERVEDQHDFVLALASVSINKPTSAGKISDQIVMNRIVYPYFEAALQYYGIAKVPFFSIKNNSVRIERYQNVEFYWTDKDGEVQMFTNPLEYQKAHKLDSSISFKMPSPTGEINNQLTALNNMVIKTS